MDSFCGSPLWDSQVTWNTTNPDFTICFHITVLTWLPCFFLFAVTPFDLFYLFNSAKGCISHTWLSISKTVLASLLLLMSLIDLVTEIQIFVVEDTKPAHFVAPLIVSIALAITLVLIQFGRVKGERSSGVLFLFWVLFLIVDILHLRSNILSAVSEGGVNVFQLVTYCFALLFVIALVVLSAFVDQHSELQEETRDLNLCPEESASFLSRVTFWWFTSLLIQGYKKALVRENLWNLNLVDSSGFVVPRFIKKWKKEQCKARSKQKPGQDVGEVAGENIQLQQSGSDKNKYEVEIKSDYKASLPKALVKSFYAPFLIAALFKLLHDILIFVSPQLLSALIDFTQDKSAPVWRGYLLAVIMSITALVQSFILHQYFHGCMVVGMRLRTVIVSAVYRKSLVLTNSSRKSSTVGEIVNLMSVDAQRFMDLTTYLNMVWSAPFQICVCLYFLWETLGPSILAGLAVMVLFIPINAFIANANKKLQVAQMKHKDSRIKLMNEILNGIKVLKLYAWEMSFKEKVLGIREKELNVLKKSAYLNAASTFTWSCAPFLVSLTTFAVYVLSDDKNILDAKKAFVSLSLFNILRFPLSMLPMVISSLIQANVSSARLQRFLSHTELDDDNVTHFENKEDAVSIDNGAFSWDKNDDPILSGISLHVKKASLIAVVGQVGSGKSSLVSAILGDMERDEGSVNVQGSVSYVPQQAWIQNATLRDNILFSSQLDECKYYETLEACALNPDLEMLPAADMTEIGEKGINLSGGQKQRISVARAVYDNSDIYLMDDPLSAVDSHVGKHIFDKVIGPNGLLKEKTRILVTHGVNFLSQVDLIVVMVNGKISELGSFQELLTHRGAFAEFLRNYVLDEDEESEEILDEEARTVREEIMSQVSLIYHEDVKEIKQKRLEEKRKRTLSEGLKEGHSSTSINKSTTSLHKSSTSLHSRGMVGTSPRSQKHHLSDEAAEEVNLTAMERQVSEFDDVCRPPAAILKQRLKQKEGQDKDELIKAEKSETGRVKLNVFVTYMRSVGLVISVLIMVLYTLNNAAQIYANVWLSEWSNDAANQVNGTVDTDQRDMRLGIYGALGFAQAITILAATIMLFLGGIRASRDLHKHLAHNILRSPMSFYDTTPTGRILNRFNSDFHTIDLVLPEKMSMWQRCMFQVVSTILVISIFTPLFLSIILPLGVIYVLVLRFYVATSRQLKRLESVSRSPIYSHFGETIAGVSVIRAYNRQERFIAESEQKVDENQICYYPMIVSNRWLAIRLEFVGNCIVLFAALFAVIGRDSLSAGVVGLSITYALNITQTLNWMVRMTSELETNIVAVERVKEYSETPTEAEWIIEDTQPDKSWPAEGRVVFDQYSARYREGLDLVIKNITCGIHGGEKIGIVGRTGAGKSSLTLALFRIIESSEGSILIDGIDISKIGLHDLRAKLTVIPQDPVLFSGSLRMNLDPFEQFNEDELWIALEHAHLKNFVSNLTEGLDFEVTEGGENLSVGQRQLVCLGRALLRKTKILILDEATAAVDLETDDLIQSTIRTEFAECTVLTIAHRLNTIMDYTRIMVLDAGAIREFSPPHELLQDKETIFYSMAKDAGLVA